MAGASIADAGHFHSIPTGIEVLRGKLIGAGDFPDGLGDPWCIDLLGIAAGLADKKAGLVVSLVQLVTTDVGIEGGQAVHETLLLQKLQSPVNGGRRYIALIAFTKHIQELVGTQGLVALPDQLQYQLPQGCEFRSICAAVGFCPGEGRLNATQVVMGCIGRGNIHKIRTGRPKKDTI